MKALTHNGPQDVHVGAAIEKDAVGDMVSVPFDVFCGYYWNCKHGLTSNVQGMAGGACGVADMGGWVGGQAEYPRVPWGDFPYLPLPEGVRKKQNDYGMLFDIFRGACWSGTTGAGGLRLAL